MIFSSLAEELRGWYGVARSLITYHGSPAKRRRARAFYRAFVPAGGLCFDIGAHVGDRTGHFRALGARVVAVEPHPRLLRVLRLLYGSDPRVDIVAAAVGATTGNAVLHVPATNPTVGSIERGWIARMSGAEGWEGTRWDTSLPVETVTLDALVARYGVPDFCKLDIEGGEAAALAGLAQPLPTLSFEYLTPNLGHARACIARLAELGAYRFNWSQGETMRLALDAWVDEAGLLAHLPHLPQGSGDIYARLVRKT